MKNLKRIIAGALAVLTTFAFEAVTNQTHRATRSRP